MNLTGIKAFLDWLFPSNKSFGIKLLIFFSLLFSFCLMDFYLKFTSDLKINTTLKQLNQVEQLINSCQDTSVAILLRDFETHLLHEHLQVHSAFNVSISFFNALRSSHAGPHANINNEVVKANTPNRKYINPILLYFLSNYLWIIFVFWIFITARQYLITKVIWYIFAGGIVIGIISLINYLLTIWLLPFIPSMLAWGIANFIIQCFLFMAIYLLMNVATAKK